MYLTKKAIHVNSAIHLLLLSRVLCFWLILGVFVMHHLFQWADWKVLGHGVHQWGVQSEDL